MQTIPPVSAAFLVMVGVYNHHDGTVCGILAPLVSATHPPSPASHYHSNISSARYLGCLNSPTGALPRPTILTLSIRRYDVKRERRKKKTENRPEKLKKIVHFTLLYCVL